MALQRCAHFGLEQLTPACGAVVSGLDLSGHHDIVVMRELHNALCTHGVLFFRDQHKLSSEKAIHFGEQWGPLEGPHPIYSLNKSSPIAVVAHDADHPPDNAQWHSDCSWSKSPPFASLLWPKVLPPCGGDTLWLSSTAAFKRLSPGLQQDLRGLSAVHDFGSFRNHFHSQDPENGIDDGYHQFGSAVHPIIFDHPVTGQPYIFVNECFTMHVVGLMADESRSLLNYLFSVLYRPDLQVRWRWRHGDVAIWDNRHTQHFASADYFPSSRRMHRLTILTDALAEVGRESE